MEYHHSLQDAVMEYHLQEERDIEASSSSSSPDSPTRESIINQIESIFTALSTALSTTTTTTTTTAAAAAPLQLSLVPRRKTPSSNSSSSPSSNTTPTTVSFPQNARRFACILKLLDTMHATLTASQPPRTKRDIFYQHPALFQHQRTVDRLTDDLAATLHVPRSALGVVASAKGMLYGDVTLGGRSFLVDGGSVLIPGALHGAGVGARVAWVLVVEKEAVFRSLACGGGRDGGGVVVTGKGYPDVATREAVRVLQDVDGGRLVLGAVVDWDPDGVEILGTYRFGSGAMGWERGRLAAERVEWWGVRSADLEEAVARGGGGVVEGVLRLTARDRRKARGVLGRAWMADVPEWRRELQVMLFLGVKAETEIVSGVGMRAWVEGKIAARMGAGV